MKAVILAAGIGSRLKPLTDYKPKCLINVGNKSILEMQIDAYSKIGIDEIIIVGGYKFEMIKDFCTQNIKNDVKIKLINNIKYLDTNNMYSLYLAKEEICGHDFLLSNGDVILDERIINIAIEMNGESIAFYDSSDFDEEELKLQIQNDVAYEILPKGPISNKCSGSTIGFFVFNKSSSKYMYEDMERTLYEKKLQNEWFEMSLNNIFKITPFTSIDVKGLQWVEIDTEDDLKKAEYLFSPNLQSE